MVPMLMICPLVDIVTPTLIKLCQMGCKKSATNPEVASAAIVLDIPGNGREGG